MSPIVVAKHYFTRATVIAGDAHAKHIHGCEHPIAWQRLFVDQAEITAAVRLWKRGKRAALQRASFGDHIAGLVNSMRRSAKAWRFIVGGDWDLERANWTDTPIFENTRAVIRDGLSWAEAGEEQRLMRSIARKGVHEGCRTLDDVQRRLEKLDEIIAECRLTGRLRTQDMLSTWSVRERGGIAVALGRNGDILFARDGLHRLSIARCLKLSRIPVSLARVHPMFFHTQDWQGRLGSLMVVPPLYGDAQCRNDR